MRSKGSAYAAKSVSESSASDSGSSISPPAWIAPTVTLAVLLVVALADVLETGSPAFHPSGISMMKPGGSHTLHVDPSCPTLTWRQWKHPSFALSQSFS